MNLKDRVYVKPDKQVRFKVREIAVIIENRIKKNETKQIVVYDFLLKRVIEKNLLLSVVKILIFVLKLT